jgi:hypothetical protein
MTLSLRPIIAENVIIDPHGRAGGYTRASGIERVIALELFLDLVFVFAVTQLTQLVAHPHDPADYAQAALAFAVMMWMYDGFAWVTSNLRVESDGDYWLKFAASPARGVRCPDDNHLDVDRRRVSPRYAAPSL